MKTLLMPRSFGPFMGNSQINFEEEAAAQNVAGPGCYGILNLASSRSLQNTRIRSFMKERFAEYWLDCQYERALELINSLSTKEVVDYAYYIATHFGLKDLDFFNKLLN